MTWSLHQLFPICPVNTCPKYRTRHMLPIQEEVATQILTGDETYIYWQAGVGASKTLLWGALAAAYMIMIPGADIILCRKDFALLYDTLWKYFQNSLKAANEQGIISGNFDKYWKGRSKKATSYCELPNGSIARAVQLKNFSEAMGPNRDAIFISDAMENDNFGYIFHGEGTVGGLQSRLRGQTSTFFRLADARVKDMRRFLIESNPPPNINELHQIFGREPGVREFPNTTDPVTGKSVTYRHIQTSNIVNDHNPASYRAEIASMHSDPNDILRILEGKSIPYYGGVRVISTFVPEIHVSKFEIDPNLPLFVGIDPGYQHPAAVFSQIKRCSYDKEHVIRLSEVSNLFEKTTNEFVEWNQQAFQGILAHLQTFYPSHFDYDGYMSLFNQYRKLRAQEDKDYDVLFHYSTMLEQFFVNVQFCIDRSGEKKYSTNKDRETDRTILLKQYGIRCKYRTNIGLDRSLDRVREAFKTMCICGIPEQLVDQNCELLIDAYSGGYRYTKNKDGTHQDKPVQDHRYEDVADADRYLLENFFFGSALEVPEQQHQYEFQKPPYQWMYGSERI